MANTGIKRKRDSADHSGAPDAPPPPQPAPEYEPAFEAQYLQHTGEGEMTLAEALAQHNAGNDHSSHDNEHDDATNGQSVTDTANAALHFSMTVPPPTEETFLAQTTNEQEHEQEDRPSEPNFDIDTATNEYTNISNDPPPDVQQESPSQPQPQPPAQVTPAEDESPTSGSKPNVGSDEWHRVRRDNHKEGKPPKRPIRHMTPSLTPSSGAPPPRND